MIIAENIIDINFQSEINKRFNNFFKKKKIFKARFFKIRFFEKIYFDDKIDYRVLFKYGISRFFEKVIWI